VKFSVEELLDELAARRRRMAKRFSPLLGGLLEFFMLGGLVLGVAAAFLGRPWGVLPLAGWVGGYFLLDRRRQAALAAGGDPEVVQRANDPLALALTVALAALGLWVFVGAMAAKDEAGWTKPADPLPAAVDLTIVK
jgi:hypothetical protein